MVPVCSVRSLSGVALALVTVAACSSAVELASVGVSYEPASGVKLLEEVPGPPAVARFSGDLAFSMSPGLFTLPAEKDLEAALSPALGRAGLVVEGTVASARLGSLHLGPVARYELRAAAHRTLVYLVPAGTRLLAITLKVPNGGDVKTESTFERTLSSIRLR